MRAWLVTWEWSGNHAAVADKVVAIFDPRWSSERVAPLVDLLYVIASATLRQAAEYAKRRRNNPYRARIDKDGTIYCGNHPYLFARRVENLEIVEDPATLLETVYWTELPLSRFLSETFEVVTIGREQHKRYRRRMSGPISCESVWDRRRGTFKPGWETYSVETVVEPVPGTGRSSRR